MENIFNLKDYFSWNYGLGTPPPQFRLKGWMKLLYILIVPIILYILSKRKRAKWQEAYDFRYNTWYKDFDNFYAETIKSMNLEDRGIEKIGIDGSQTEDVKPFAVHSPKLGGKKFPKDYRLGPDGKLRTDMHEVTWFYFTKEQIYSYTITFTLSGKTSRIEEIKEFFYPDIVSIKTYTEYEKIPLREDKSPLAKKEKSIKGVKDATATENTEVVFDEKDVEEVAIEEFRIAVSSGESMGCSIFADEGVSKSIKGMRSLIREKKIAQYK